jgi:DNA-binding SARP family transcriptional activator
MEFGILGPLEVRDGSGLVRVPGVKERALLVDLLVHAGQVVSADRLVEDLWGDARRGTGRIRCRVGCRGCGGRWGRVGPSWW